MVAREAWGASFLISFFSVFSLLSTDALAECRRGMPCHQSSQVACRPGMPCYQQQVATSNRPQASEFQLHRGSCFEIRNGRRATGACVKRPIWQVNRFGQMVPGFAYYMIRFQKPSGDLFIDMSYVGQGTMELPEQLRNELFETYRKGYYDDFDQRKFKATVPPQVQQALGTIHNRYVPALSVAPPVQNQAAQNQSGPPSQPPPADKPDDASGRRFEGSPSEARHGSEGVREERTPRREPVEAERPREETPSREQAREDKPAEESAENEKTVCEKLQDELIADGATRPLIPYRVCGPDGVCPLRGEEKRTGKFFVEVREDGMYFEPEVESVPKVGEAFEPASVYRFILPFTEAQKKDRDKFEACFTGSVKATLGFVADKGERDEILRVVHQAEVVLLNVEK